MTLIPSWPQEQHVRVQAIIVMDDSVDIVEALANVSAFYAHSCGQYALPRGFPVDEQGPHRLTSGKEEKKTLIT